MLKNKIFIKGIMLTFRITANDDETIRKVFKEKKVLICKEGSDAECAQEHYHGILYEYVTRQTLRNWILDGFGDEAYEVRWNSQEEQYERGKSKGNKFYSISKTKDEAEELENFERYVCKGLKEESPRIVLNTQGVDTSDRYSAYWRVNEACSRKVKKARSKTYKEMFKEYIIDKYVSSDYSWRRVSLKELIVDYRKFCLENDIDPTPATSGETMFIQLLSRLNNDDKEDERWYEYYGRRIETVVRFD